ncbi:response regulator [Sediminibacillus halophilus]|uniref:Two-component response regulator, SAPR family, consists of REC, wHTH and BTAD domains n=1 Tax=Sediminibacillus halophilus TaxID=482461 RepID=A0A1G9WBA4_9BACI|nr:response regulator [Sediminibacillus halophilus]SDM81834.1 Two-component response regulator, SAPR family, consists of REC, wHTH and BTAD domains [Sediminibacillus halophilus]
MKVILIDDESLALDFLEFQINKIENADVIGKYNYFDAEKHTDLLAEVDVIFLDIEMPEINGLELAEKLLEINANISIVFVTAFNHYAVQAFELNALDYVLKPVQFERLKKTLERVERKVNNQKHPSFVKDDVLRINVSRELTFELNGGTTEFISWRTAKSQELFLYLLHHENKTVRKSEIVELIWTEFGPEKAYSQLYTAIYHIRKTLKKFNDHFIIKNVGEGYNLSTQKVSIDLAEWEHKMKTAPKITTETIDYFEKNMKLYKGGYLQEYHYLWAEAECYRLEQVWLKIAFRLASYYVKQKDVEKAETWYKKICLLRPEDEDAHFSLMKLYDSSGMAFLVDRQYHELEEALKAFDLQISTNVKTWFTQWKENKKSIR